MFRGNVDRSGTREGKKTSLRKTGKDKKIASAEKNDEQLVRDVGPIPFINSNSVIIDCGGNLVNRNLEADSSRVISRAIANGIGGMVIVTNSFEKSETSISMCEANPGVIYCVVGIHPSNISAKKMSDRLFLELMKQLKVHAVNQHVVGLYAGLDYERDYGLKFPQEKFMKAQISLAQELDLPMILQDLGNGDGLLEVMKESRKNFKKGMIYAYNGNSELLKKYNQLDFYIGFNGILCDMESDEGSIQRDLITQVPLNRILLVSDAPNHTPQNIPDQFVREAKNEPSNLIYVLQIVSQCLKMELKELKELLLNNAKEFYNLSPKELNIINEDVDVNNNNATSTTATTTSTNSNTVVDDDEEEEDDEDDEEEEEEDSNKLFKEFTEKLSKLDKKKLQYCCKKCRTRLFKFEDVIEHEEQIKILDTLNLTNSKKSKGNINNSSTSSNNNTGFGCKSMFVDNNKFNLIDSNKTKDNIKVDCMKCGSKLGSYSWNDEQCSCGKKEKQVCRIIKSRIEAVLLDDNGIPIDISSLNINSDDESDNDSDEDGKKSGKKKKAKKTNIKKDNKRNLSSYRNKSDSITTASKSTAKDNKSKSQQPPNIFGELDENSDSSDNEI